MKANPLPPNDYLHECFIYNPLTGELSWKPRPRKHFSNDGGQRISNAKFAGTIAGCRCYQSDGRKSGIRIGINVHGKFTSFYAHRIIYALSNVNVPDGMDIDHKNNDPFQNQWDNLRIATKNQNQANRKRNNSHNLPKGVRQCRNKFRAQIASHGKKFHIGYFSSPDVAHAAYCAKAKELNPMFARFS